MTDLNTILYFCRQRNDPLRVVAEQKWDKFRKILNGDLGWLHRGYYSHASDSKDERRPANDTAGEVDREQIEVTDYDPSYNNRIFRNVRSVVGQLAFDRFDFDFEGISGLYEQGHRAYFEKAWGASPFGSEAASKHRSAIWDMVTCGIGWFGVSLAKGYPSVVRYAPQSVLYDVEDTIHTAKWQAIWEKRRAREWAKVFKSKAAKERLAPFLEENNVVELVFYYDVFDEDGTSCVFFCNGRDVIEEPLDGPTISPWYTMLETANGGVQKVVFLPASPLVYSSPSGASTPVGLVQMLLPQQLLLQLAERQRSEAFMQRPATVIDTRKFDQATIDTLKSGVWPRLWFSSGGDPTGGVSFISPPPLDPAILSAIQDAEVQMRAVSDDPAYSSGVSQDVKFAREVDQLAQQGAMGLSVLGEEVSTSAEVVAQRFLWLVKEHEDRPWRLRIGDTDLQFSGEDGDAVRDFVDPYAEVKISAQVKKSREVRMAEAQALFNVLAPLGYVDAGLNLILDAAGNKSLSSEISKAKAEQAGQVQPDEAMGEPMEQGVV